MVMTTDMSPGADARPLAYKRQKEGKEKYLPEDHVDYDRHTGRLVPPDDQDDSEE